MKRIVSVFIVIVCGLLMGGVVHGSQETELMANRHDINGYSIAFYENNKIVFENYGEGINEKSVFELASNGKVISSYIAWKLIDEGKLKLEDKIAPFLVLIVLLMAAFVAGKMTKFRFFSFRGSLPVCFLIAGIVNTLFLLHIVPKVVVFFGLYLAFMGLVLFLARKNTKVFYASMPLVMILIFVLGFAVPVSIPVTNDIVAKTPNSAYTLKSTSEDMAMFCQELMNQYGNRDGDVEDMFSAAVNIDTVNSWGTGIGIESENQGETYWHSGINPGFQSLFVLYPLQDKYVIILTNSDNGLQFSKEVANAFLQIDGSWDIPR